MITEAAAPLFAKKGFAGTTTKEIARAAEVSEALLYKHFPSKEALYSEMQVSTCSVNPSIVNMIMSLPPGTDTLIIAIYYFFRHILVEKEEYEHQNIKRLMLHSLVEDGQFAKTFLETRMYPVVDKFVQCIDEAVRVGDIDKDWVPPKLGTWLMHHIATSMGFMALPRKDLVDYGCSKEEAMVHAVRFTLRGIGLKDEILKTKVNAVTLAAQIDQLRET
ncbi:MAG: TetR/AcrR family transcriptional regulator [bacterium]|nr:TetR/AcrR family transcriptional regulator [bacterium]